MFEEQGTEAREPLTPAERDVLALANRGMTNREIGRQLGITRNAVRFHLKHIHGKLGTGGHRSRLARPWAFALAPLGALKGASTTVVTMGMVGCFR